MNKEIKPAQQSPCRKFITHRLTLRVMNCHVIFLLIFANIIRLARFQTTDQIIESTKEDGTVTVTHKYTPVAFMFVIITIFVLPPLIALFVLVEFKIKPQIFQAHFEFLDYPIGKGIYIIMMGFMISEVQQITDAIFAILICLLGLCNIALGIAYLTLSFSQEQQLQGDEEIQIMQSNEKMGASDLKSKVSDKIVTNAKFNKSEIIAQTFMPLAESDSVRVNLKTTPEEVIYEEKEQITFAASIVDNQELQLKKAGSKKKKTKKQVHSRTKTEDNLVRESKTAEILADSKLQQVAAEADISQSQAIPQFEDLGVKQGKEPSLFANTNSTKVEKELEEAAYALFSELKRCLRKRDFKSFENVVIEARRISKAKKVGRTAQCLINKVADLKEHDGKNLLHLAAGIAANEDDPRFFVRLLDLKFPLYSADNDYDFPAFLLCSAQNDSKFMTAYYALMDAGFDLNFPNPDGITFLQKLIITGEHLSMDKIQGIIKTRPNLSMDNWIEIEAKVALSWVRTNNPVVKSAMSALKEYVLYLETQQQM